jgi:hypothetical protein
MARIHMASEASSAVNPIQLAKLFEERVPEYIHRINAYVPGRPIEEVEREL